MLNRDHRTTRMFATGLFALAGLGLAGCGSEGGETGADVEEVTGEEEAVEEPVAEEPVEEEPVAEEPVEGEPFVGPLDSSFMEQADTYVGQEVTLSAEVTELLSPESFVIGEDTEQLLVIESQEIPEVDLESSVEVTGTLKDAFDIVTVEEELGVDLEDELYTDFEGGRYLMATSADVQSS